VAGAESIAASPARALLHARQKASPSNWDQDDGSSVGPPSIRPTETSQRAQLHLTASAVIAQADRQRK
jgi:hypothetical protein